MRNKGERCTQWEIKMRGRREVPKKEVKMWHYLL
jgi:hypothetical protein